MSSVTDSVVLIDCHYGQAERVAAYLIVEDERAAFVDNNTPLALPHLLGALAARGLSPDAVEYLMVTHVHLDHSAGTAALLECCPKAQVLAHPRAVRHLADPTRLVAGTKQVYGEEVFGHLYGTVVPVPEDRIQAVGDGDRISLGGRTLTFLHTRGHANHHCCIHDSKTNGVFTGDAFGIAYPALQRGRRPLLTCSSTPTEFDAAEARRSVDAVAGLNPAWVYLTHFGALRDVPACAAELRRSIDQLDRILMKAAETDLVDEALYQWCEAQVRTAIHQAAMDCGLTLGPGEQSVLEFDTVMNAKGLAYAAAKKRA